MRRRRGNDEPRPARATVGRGAEVAMCEQTPEPGAGEPDRVFTVRELAVVRNDRPEPVDDHWGAVISRIELVPAMSARALAGLDEFSHVDVVFAFDRVDPLCPVSMARHPRGNPAWPEVGIFAQRGRDRPNRLGVSTCALVAVLDRAVLVRGLDAIDGTPVLDIKPHLVEFGPRGPVRQPAWSRELMAHYYD